MIATEVLIGGLTTFPGPLLGWKT